MSPIRTGWYIEKHSIWIPIGEGLLTFIVIANFTLATFMDPGVIPKGWFCFRSIISWLKHKKFYRDFIVTCLHFL